MKQIRWIAVLTVLITGSMSVGLGPSTYALAAPSMLTSEEITGGALSATQEFQIYPSEAESAVSDLNREGRGVEQNIDPTALESAQMAQDQLLWIETFLKSGPASGRDLGQL